MRQAESQLINQVLEGSQTAFELLFKEYEAMIYGIALRVMQSETDAADVAQEIILKIYLKLDQYQHQAKFSTWLYRLAMNTAIDEYRKRKRRVAREESMDKEQRQNGQSLTKQWSDSRPQPEEEYIRQETAEEEKEYLWQAFAKLSEKDQTILICREVEQMSYQQMADYLGCPIGTIRSRLARARKSLYTFYQEVIGVEQKALGYRQIIKCLFFTFF